MATSMNMMMSSDRYEVQIRKLGVQDRTRYRAIEVQEPASHTTHEIATSDEEIDANDGGHRGENMVADQQ